ncbi:MAG: tetratricopeptide repeat protein [candidate division KSB1 bacterium]|nr:tetratricopeptide repeat protein [candidate division KSB1 bacterium]MDZ7274849.1 tetratricopeptide repeat protein [candidate division KSB1 bacterium]MDZ7288216.1 tetratricopeptide repeat protein [candidate division KSB1 bacterium]MDZ7300403.1 tetratricopeptide repeat protein [candidate division KSB1 bacterium]MDZ7308778.1 tetratricopeptide repeat protein [candidate division KSB1 bacterium]
MKRFCVVWLLPLLLGISWLGCTTSATKKSGEKSVRRDRSMAAADPRAAELVIRGALAELQEDYAAALNAYQEAAVYDTASASLMNAIGEAYLALGNLPTAEQSFKRALRLDPTYIPARENLAHLYQRQGRSSAAAREYETILTFDPENAAALFNLAALSMGQRDSRRAIEMLQRLVDLGKAGPREWLALGTLYLSEKNYDEAEAAFAYFIKDAPGEEQGYLAVSSVYAARQDTLRLINWYEKALARNAEFHRVRDSLKEIFLARGDRRRAIALIEQRAALDSTDLEARLELHQLHLANGDTLAARASLDQVVRSLHQRWQRDSSDVRLMLQLSELYRLRNDSLQAAAMTDRAIAALLRKVTDDSSDIEDTEMLGRLYLSRGDTAGAQATYQRWVARAPGDFRGYLLLGRLSYNNKQWQRAVDYLEQALQIENALPDAWMMHGHSNLLLNRTAEAQQSFERAVELDPGNPLANFFLGFCLSQLRQHEQALPYLRRAVARNPGEAGWWGTLAATLDELGRHAASDSAYQHALKLAPEDATLLNNYSYSLSVRGERLEEALTMVKKALEKEPANGAFLDTIGWVYYQMGKYELALEYIQKSVAVRDNSAEVLEHLGDVYDKLGQPERAREYWQKALELERDRASVRQKLGVSRDKP